MTSVKHDEAKAELKVHLREILLNDIENKLSCTDIHKKTVFLSAPFYNGKTPPQKSKEEIFDNVKSSSFLKKRQRFELLLSGNTF